MRFSGASCFSLIASIFLFHGVALGAAPTAKGALPENAIASRYGDGWECKRGFIMQAGVCTAIAIPPHASLDSYGNQWSCDRGYERRRDSCAPIVIPANAYANHAGPTANCGC